MTLKVHGERVGLDTVEPTVLSYLTRAAVFADVTGCVADEVYVSKRDMADMVSVLKPLFDQTSALPGLTWFPNQLGRSAGFDWFLSEGVPDGQPRFWCAARMGPFCHPVKSGDRDGG